MLRSFILTVCTIGAGLVPTLALASVRAEINIAAQTMQVYVDGRLRHTWTISTGRRGYETPTGTYRPYRLERDWHSTIYDAPMPYSVFFSGGYAIHGGHVTGRPASHGCIRLSHGAAATFFNLVASRGSGSTRIEIDQGLSEAKVTRRTSDRTARRWRADDTHWEEETTMRGATLRKTTRPAVGRSVTGSRRARASRKF